MKLLNSPTGELAKKLDGYLKQNPTYKAVYDYTKERFEKATELTAHNWEHAYRDTLNAIVIGEAEGADMRIVLPAITMHDIGFLYGATGRTHGAIGADKLVEYLKDANVTYSTEDTAKIASCIRTPIRAACMMSIQRA
jgi:HD superfamily phosphodiesterase